MADDTKPTSETHGAASVKAGARHSLGDIRKGQSVKQKAREIVADMDDLGFPDEEKTKHIPNFRKAITDAPDLRGSNERRCSGCKFFRYLPPMISYTETGEQVYESSSRGICEKFEFETSSEYVCDAWKDRYEDIADATIKAVMLAADGSNALKAISETPDELRAGNYIVLFGGRDLEGTSNKNVNPDGSRGEFFTKATQFDSDATRKGQFPIDWEHNTILGKAIDGIAPGDYFGYVDWKTAKMDERGVWVERVLNRRHKYMQYLEVLIKQGLIGNSAEAHGALKAANGEITKYPLVRDTFTVQPMEPRMMTQNVVVALKALGIDTPAPDSQSQATGSQSAADAGKGATQPATKAKGNIDMDEKDLIALLDKRDADKAAAARAEAEQQAKIEAEKDAAVKAAKAQWDADAAKERRLPLGDGKITGVTDRRYDHLDGNDLALLYGVMKASGKHMSETAIKACAVKFETQPDKHGEAAVAVKALFDIGGIKANELNHTTQAGFGDEWIGVAYSTRLWEAIRQGTFVGQRLSAGAIEVPPGNESIFLPLEGADPTFYKVGETTGNNATTGIPDATVPASKVATDRKQLTLAKMGARTIWSGEMEEDSLIAFVSQLRRQLETAGMETFEHVLIDGDTATGATVNINDIAGTPAGNEAFLLVNGFRKSPLVTTTANSRSAGALTAEDFLETLKLMGLAGRNADKRYTEFILDKWTSWKALELPEVKTRDVFAQPTLENGELTGIYGYKVNTSAFMHWANQDATFGLKANTAGKVDLDTAANNTTGSILAVRFDQWQLGFRRRMTIETQRIPQADATQIVALMRFGLVQRDTEAAAISYGVTL